MAITINGNGTITGISVGGLPDGIVDTNMIANSAVTSAKASGLGGLTMVDMWHVSAETSFQSETAITSWARTIDSAVTGAGNLGSAMSNSGQYFTFPETGVYEIEYQSLVSVSAAESRYVASYIYSTTDGSNYARRARGYGAVHQDSSQTTFSFGCKYLFDVTNTSTHKVYFSNLAEASAWIDDNYSNAIYSYALFRKLGDT